MKGKKLIFCLSLILAGNSITPVLANKDIAVTNNNSLIYISTITPSDLVYSSYQGQFTNVGIPSYSKLSSEVKSGKIDAEYLVSKGIEAGRLNREKINDRNYIRQVKFLLRDLDRD